MGKRVFINIGQIAHDEACHDFFRAGEQQYVRSSAYYGADADALSLYTQAYLWMWLWLEDTQPYMYGVITGELES